MRDLHSRDAMFFAFFSHLFAGLFIVFCLMESQKHECTGMVKYFAFQIFFNVICLIFFFAWTVYEWRRERAEENRLDGYSGVPSELAPAGGGGEDDFVSLDAVDGPQ